MTPHHPLGAPAEAAMHGGGAAAATASVAATATSPAAVLTASRPARDDAQRMALAARYVEVRSHTTALVAPLSPEDQVVQSMPDASPAKWHLAHTTWFFETVVLGAFDPTHEPFDARYSYLFNSYYEALGKRHPRPARGLLTRPTLTEVCCWREHVDTAMLHFVAHAGEAQWAQAAPMIELGLQHEQQHQELILTDILHLFSQNPLLPAYQPSHAPVLRLATPHADSPEWVRIDGGVTHIGAEADSGFYFDNEGPRQDVLLAPYEIASRLVTCGDYLEFIEAGGYRDPKFWLSDGWAMVQQGGWEAPACWLAPNDERLPAHGWQVFGLAGVKPLDQSQPVMQLSFYEAAAYAEWAGARLPTEFEWEAAAAHAEVQQMHGHAWQWTRSAYEPYPGFRPLEGMVSEYNGKFMCGQQVLRGSSLATPKGHARPTYRNFFAPGARWQFSGLRLARTV